MMWSILFRVLFRRNLDIIIISRYRLKEMKKPVFSSGSMNIAPDCQTVLKIDKTYTIRLEEQMDRTEFLEALREKLKEGMSERDISEQVNYYSKYILDEVRGGKPESQVLEELGNPTLLARTILDTHGQMEDDPAAENIQQNHQNGGQSRERSWSIKTDRNWGCIVAAVVVVLVLGIVLWLVGSIFRFLSPILVPVLIILLITSSLKKR